MLLKPISLDYSPYVTFPPTVKEYDLPDNIFDYSSYPIGLSAYIYYYILLVDYILKSGKVVPAGTIYVGAHGSDKESKYFDGSYWHSSKNDEFNEIYYNTEKAVLKFVIEKRNLLSTGWTGVKNKEERIIRKKKKENPDMIFNIGYGIKEYATMDIDDLQDLAKLIKNQQKDDGFKTFTENEVEVKKQTKNYGVDFAQPRAKERTEDVAQMSLQIKHHGTDKAKKLVKFMNWQNSGRDLIIDKSTTLKAFKSSDSPLIDQIEIPYDYHKDFDIEEAKYLGLLLNANEEENPVIEKNTDVADSAKMLTDNWFAKGWDKDDKNLRGHPEIYDWLKPFNLGDYGRASAIDKAENDIKKKGVKSAGKTEKDWSADEYQPDLWEKLQNLRKENPHLLVTVLSSGAMGSWHEELNKQLFYASEGKYKKLVKSGKGAVSKWRWVYEKQNINYNRITGVLIIVNHGSSYSMKDEFDNGKKNKKGIYVGNSNWTNFYNWFTHQSRYTLKKDELLMYQEDTNVKKAA